MVNYKKTKDVKEKIKSIASKMFSFSRYDNVKVEDIAKEAGVAKGLIFYHFTSKEKLLSEILKDEAKTMFVNFTTFIKDLPPDTALLQLFQGMFATTKPLNIAEGFFEGSLPQKYHYAVDNARLETIFPIIYDLIKRGSDEGLFFIEEVEISYAIISMGFNSYLNTHFHMFADVGYHKSFLKSAAYILNSTLNPTKTKFAFKLHDNDIS